MVFTEYLSSAAHVVGQAANFSLQMGQQVLKSTGIIQNSPKEVKLPAHLENLDVSSLVRTGSGLVKLAAVSGAMAVVLGAYGAHTLPEKEDSEERRMLYETANKYHFLHTLAILGSPLCRNPRTVAVLMTGGMVLFCGTCYYHALTGDKRLRKCTPVGGALLIFGWLSMIL